jgi:hypothetical protein
MDADPDQTYHFDPYPAYHFDADADPDPDPAFQFDADAPGFTALVLEGNSIIFLVPYQEIFSDFVAHVPYCLTLIFCFYGIGTDKELI